MAAPPSQDAPNAATVSLVPSYSVAMSEREHSGASTSRVAVDTPLPTTNVAATYYFAPVQPSWPPADAHYVLLSPFSTDGGSVPNVASPRPLLLFAEPPPLPPYVRDAEDPSPPYDRVNRNPDTLARHLFQLGFAFPLLWVINVIIILHPLQIHPADETAIDRCKTEEERLEELAIMRSIELRWARRSAIALAIFILLLTLILVVVLGRRRG